MYGFAVESATAVIGFTSQPAIKATANKDLFGQMEQALTDPAQTKLLVVMIVLLARKFALIR